MASLFRETGEFSIELPGLSRPTLAWIQARWSWFRSIKSDVSPEGPVILVPGTFLSSSERWIDGKEYEKRRKPHLAACLGLQHAVWLKENRERFPELTAFLRKLYLYFPGIVAVHEDGGQFFPCLRGPGERLFLDWGWPDDGLDSHVRVASSK